MVVTGVEAKAKLSQNRSDEDQAGVVEGLSGSADLGAAAVRDEMVRRRSGSLKTALRQRVQQLALLVGQVREQRVGEQVEHLLQLLQCPPSSSADEGDERPVDVRRARRR